MTEDELSTPGFIARLKAGDNQAFAELISLTSPRLCRALKADLNLCHEDAEEIVLDTFLKLSMKGLSFKAEGRAKLTSWLRTVVVNAGIDFVRRRSIAFEAKAKVASAEVDEVSTRTHFDDQAVIEWRREQCNPEDDTPAQIVGKLEVVERAIQNLLEKDRDILRLRTCLSYEQIAEIENEPVGTLKTRHFRALQRLKMAVEKEQI